MTHNDTMKVWDVSCAGGFRSQRERNGGMIIRNRYLGYDGEN